MSVFLSLTGYYVFTLTGPGAYDSRLNGRIGNPMITKDKRFNITFRDEVPGPGAYEVSIIRQ